MHGAPDRVQRVRGIQLFKRQTGAGKRALEYGYAFLQVLDSGILSLPDLRDIRFRVLSHDNVSRHVGCSRQIVQRQDRTSADGFDTVIDLGSPCRHGNGGSGKRLSLLIESGYRILIGDFSLEFLGSFREITDIVRGIEGILEYGHLEFRARRERPERCLVALADLPFRHPVDIHIDLRDLEHQDKGAFPGYQERIVDGNYIDKVHSVCCRLSGI